VKKFRALSRTAANIPTTSMADIAFLLIIFFMVTAEFSVRKGLDFSLPPADEAAAAAQSAAPVVIDVDPGGRLTIDGAASNLEDIKRTLTPRLEASPNQWVIVKSDGRAQYGSVVEVLDQLKLLGVKNIALPTRQELVSWGQK
jgi:biopolymer transport protein ExbD